MILRGSIGHVATRVEVTDRKTRKISAGRYAAWLVGAIFSCLGSLVGAADSSGFYLQFPVSGYTPFTAPVSSVFDHANKERYQTDGRVTAFNGLTRTGTAANGCYANGQAVVVSGLNYVGARSAGGTKSLCYDGHPGWDYAFPYGTEVHAAADGWVYDVTPAGETASGSGCTKAKPCGTVYVRHDAADTLRTYYLHLSVQSRRSGQRIARGDVIGLSGSTGTTAAHLHFEVRRRFGSVWTPAGAYSVDPYGTFQGDPHPRAAQMVSLWTSPSLRPAAPSRTFAAPLSYTSVKVGWNDNATNELGVRLYRWAGNYWLLLRALPANARDYTDTGLQSSTKYYYMVCAWNAATGSSEGACDNFIDVTTPAPPPFGGHVFRIDGSQSSTRAQGDRFTFTGAGFTPYGKVDRWLENLNTGTVTQLNPTLWADRNGTVDWTYTVPCTASSLGTYVVWAVDVSYGWSYRVTEVVTPGVCR